MLNEWHYKTDGTHQTNEFTLTKGQLPLKPINTILTIPIITSTYKLNSLDRL